MADLNKLAEQIVGLTLLQAQELKTILKDTYGTVSYTHLDVYKRQAQ